MGIVNNPWMVTVAAEAAIASPPKEVGSARLLYKGKRLERIVILYVLL